MKLFLVFLMALATNNAFCDNKSLEAFYGLYKKGNYQKAIEALDALNADQEGLASKYYLKGLSYSKLQEYDKAVEVFQKAIDEKIQAKDIYYEYGQALYAINKLPEAITNFKKSYENKFNENASLYYVGHISQILENYSEARKVYYEIIKSKNTDTKIGQIARFQLAETLLAMLRQNEKNKEKQKEEVSKKILPMLKLALDFDRESLLSSDIEKRRKEIQKEFDLDPDLLANGKRINSKRFNSYFDVKTKFDDNVTNTNLENDIQQSHKESYFIESELDLKYDFVIKKRLITSPELRLNFTQYSNQDESDIYQNDSMLMAFDLKNKIEHTVKNFPASFIFDIDYTKTYKDYKKEHSRDSYSNSKMVTIGEQFSLTSRGDTTIKFKYKDYAAYSEDLNNHTYTYSIDQSLSIANSKLLIILFEIDQTKNYNSTASSTSAYLLRFDYIYPDLLPKYTLTTSLSTTLTDTLEQKATRGFETTINPTIEIAKDLNDKIKGILSIDYIKNQSKSSDYTYHKFVTNLELKYTF